MSCRVLSFHYELTNASGKKLDSSRGGEPFPVMEGRKQIIPGLEEELFKMNIGEKKRVEVPAAKAYGTLNEKLKVKVSRDKLPEGNLEIGTRFSTGPEHDSPVFTVVKIEGDEISLDGNHPLAGQDLTFDVEVMAIREATSEETAHGHAHGGDGHHHH